MEAALANDQQLTQAVKKLDKARQDYRRDVLWKIEAATAFPSAILAAAAFVVVILQLVDLSPGKEFVLHMDLFIWGAFAIDLLIRFLVAPSKRDFIVKDWGWLNILIVALPPGRIINSEVARFLVRLFRLPSFLGEFLEEYHRGRQGTKGGGWDQAVMEFEKRRLQASGRWITVLIVVLAGISWRVLVVERHVPADPTRIATSSGTVVERHAPTVPTKIATSSDALWWTVQTIATVGYGDKVPLTAEGRVLGFLVMSLGIGVYAFAGGLITRFLIGGRWSELVKETKEQEDREVGSQELTQELQKLREQLTRIENTIQTRKETVTTMSRSS